MSFTLPDLPYSHDALENLGMSKETLEFHHDLHHKAYVDNGNKLIAGTEWESKSVEDIIKGTYNDHEVAQMEYSTTLHSIGIILNFGK